MNRYEIINPSDAYTFSAPDFATAAAAVLLLGEGKYGARSEDDTERLPVFLFGGSGPFIVETFGAVGLSDWIDAHRAAIADALDSVMSYGFRERGAFDAACELLSGEALQGYRAKLHDANRSSMNDIGSRAWAIAARLREPVEVQP